MHKLPVSISRKTPKPPSVFELRHQKWLGDGQEKKKKTKMELNFERIFDNPYSRYPIFLDAFAIFLATYQSYRVCSGLPIQL